MSREIDPGFAGLVIIGGIIVIGIGYGVTHPVDVSPNNVPVATPTKSAEGSSGMTSPDKFIPPTIKIPNNCVTIPVDGTFSKAALEAGLSSNGGTAIRIKTNGTSETVTWGDKFSGAPNLVNPGDKVCPDKENSTAPTSAPTKEATRIPGPAVTPVSPELVKKIHEANKASRLTCIQWNDLNNPNTNLTLIYDRKTLIDAIRRKGNVDPNTTSFIDVDGPSQTIKGIVDIKDGSDVSGLTKNDVLCGVNSQ